MSMNAHSEIVQTVFDFAIREINALEVRIVAAEDDADAMLWEQAAQVVAQLNAGLSMRDLAAQWINRNGEPYGPTHVHYVARVFSTLNTRVPRPRFREAYNAIAHGTTPHVAQNTGNNEWYTPQPYIDAARQVLGAIDLDPASSADANTVVRAARYFTKADDGLTQRWSGRVWLNPPYAQPLITQFAEKLAGSVLGGDVTAAVVLVNNATETDWFDHLARVTSAICFPHGRVRFWNPESEAAAPLQGQVVLYAGPAIERFAEVFEPFGLVFVRPV